MNAIVGGIDYFLADSANYKFLYLAESYYFWQIPPIINSIMAGSFVGRNIEKEQLETLLKLEQSAFVAIVGRRRVGKTELVWHALGKSLDFEMTGIQHANLPAQLANFANKFNQYSRPMVPVAPPATWQQAFEWLKQWLGNQKPGKKKVLFFDELPWMATARANFLELLGHFWNDWAARNNVLLIICGSAASWMIRQVIHHKGSLHNRITHNIHLKPFTLAETEKLVHANGIRMERYQQTMLYMVAGGIPFYLSHMQQGLSVPQQIDRLCFAPGGLLKDEFTRLFSALYDQPHYHINIIRVLASKWQGLTRAELVQATGLKDGGSFSRVLEELEASDFIMAIAPFAKKKKDILYRLTDFYCLFYLKFMEPRKKSNAGSFEQMAQSQAWKIWAGYAFENICFQHLPQIKQALGISAIIAETSSFLYKGGKDNPGFQIDMLINRADGIIHLCECKFYDGPLTITKAYADTLRNRRVQFREITKSRKTIYTMLITPFGLVQNDYAGLPEHTFGLDVLFM